jgi:hypothetical protein
MILHVIALGRSNFDKSADLGMSTIHMGFRFSANYRQEQADYTLFYNVVACESFQTVSNLVNCNIQLSLDDKKLIANVCKFYVLVAQRGPTTRKFIV